MAGNKEMDIVYTIVDEAPELASGSFLPIIQAFSSHANVTVGTKDISLAGRILSVFPESLNDSQRQSDDLQELSGMVTRPSANVIKLPNISASVPQLKAAIAELQQQGFGIPNYADEPTTDAEKDARKKYDSLKGSAVNPVLREGNSDRRSAKAVKEFAKANPHAMGAWERTSKTHVASMPGNDFYANESSVTIDSAQSGIARIEFRPTHGEALTLKDNLSLTNGSVVDATFLSVKALRGFIEAEIENAKQNQVLFSIHLKATMMKVSDPILFGHAVSVFLGPIFDKYAQKFTDLGISPNAGLGDVLSRLADEVEILAEIKACLTARPALYMVDSNKGITNLHVPSDVIIDASMPAVIKAGGKGWGPDGKEYDVKCVIPDNCYAPVYDETIKYFKETGALDPSSSGAVANVGLMAQKAEEYGSHPTTFEMPSDGMIRMFAANGDLLHEHTVEQGDVWRASVTQKAAIEDWIKLAISRQQATRSHAVFWLDASRSHDAQLLAYVKPVLESEGVIDNFDILAPREATRVTLETIRKGENSISITGNVLRDYLTDLFPILELGTSAKMLSIVKLMNGGGLFETGAGGSAPKHVQQLLAENHLRWDSLGEFCALGESLMFYADTSGNQRAKILGQAAEAATQQILNNNRSPSRKSGEADNRESHYYFAMYWAEALADQPDDKEMASQFKKVFDSLRLNEEKIIEELRGAQGGKVDVGGYYHPDVKKVAQVMRPSPTLNAIINAI
ncbi:MAG: NADP-dependent isocitrate dehydrogenase [Proteobacteria bacterium]|nr:NADP-dependent isocitrate dehydrogenase [Pseudomonadota bacterium]MDA1012462.1 NADP-dependent isocitrate dehydrogenase [Pseudomonadota bacterium]|tara:strand:+ start:4741 stop:6960 length:2220 start_codon:yes stop_codon:yes gene_type:complete